jgi:hypothetical protein
VYAWHYTGDLVEGFPVSIRLDSIFTPMVADVDGDMKPDIVSSLSSARRDPERNSIYAWNYRGELIPGWPKLLRRSRGGGFLDSPFTTLGDVNGDGIIDLIASIGGGELHIISLGSKLSPDAMDWPTFRHDFRDTGRYSSNGK